MSLIGYLIHSQINNSIITSDIKNLKFSLWNKLNPGKIPIFQPYKYLIDIDPLPHSWEVTSDSIAYYITQILNIEKIILIKDVDGLFNKDPNIHSSVKFIEKISISNLEKMFKKTCIDTFLPKLIKKYRKPCTLVNGLYPSRIIKIFENRSTRYTVINL